MHKFNSSTLSPAFPFLTVEWQRKPNTTMTVAGVRMVPNTSPARQALIVAISRFWAVTSTEQAQQSRDPLSSRGASLHLPPLSAAEYGGGTTTREGVSLPPPPPTAVVEAREWEWWRWWWWLVWCWWWWCGGSSSDRSKAWWWAPFSRVSLIVIVNCGQKNTVNALVVYKMEIL